MSSAFAVTANNVQFLLTANYSAGSGTMTLPTGMGSAINASVMASCGFMIGANHPLVFTMIRSSAISSTGQITDPTKVTIYRALALTGDVLTGVNAIEGTTDQNFSINDVFAIMQTGGEIAAHGIAINALEVQINPGPLAVINGGTGATSVSEAFRALSPMNTAGDLVSGTGQYTAPVRVPGNATSVPKFLRQTGDGTNAGLPIWTEVALVPTTGAPTDTPVVGALRYDYASHILWLHEGSGVWKHSVAFT